MVILKGKSDNLEKDEHGFDLDNPKCGHDHIDDFDVLKNIIQMCIECFTGNDKTQCPAKDVLKRFEKTNKMIDGTG